MVSSTVIVWLASYPRSGNTYLRVVLHHAFGLKTYSVHEDKAAIASDEATREIVGHTPLPRDWAADSARSERGVYLVKTHDEPPGKDKAIYVIRDGRATVVSHWHYLRAYSREPSSLFAVLAGAVPFGAWSDHLRSWNPLKRENTLLLRFEQLVADPRPCVAQIADFLHRAPRSNSIPTFGDLHHINPTFFRSGRRDSWKQVFHQDHHLLFWLIHYDAMVGYGYTDDLPQILETRTELSAPDSLPAGANPLHRLRRVAEESLKGQARLLFRCRRQLKELGEQLDSARTGNGTARLQQERFGNGGPLGSGQPLPGLDTTAEGRSP